MLKDFSNVVFLSFPTLKDLYSIFIVLYVLSHLYFFKYIKSVYPLSLVKTYIYIYSQ